MSGKRLLILGIRRNDRFIKRCAKGFNLMMRHHNLKPLTGIDFESAPTLKGLGD